MVWIPRNPPFDWQTIPWQASWEPPLGESSPTPPPEEEIPWDPTYIESIAGYETSDPDSNLVFDQGTGLVFQFNDIGSAGNLPLDQLIGAQQPVTGIDSTNGLNLVRFDIDRVQQLSFPIPANGNVSVFMFARVNEVTQQNQAMFSMDASADFQFEAANATDFIGRISTSNIGGGALSTGISNGPSLYNNKFDLTGEGKLSIYIDGNFKGNGNYTSPLDSVQKLRVAVNRGVNRSLNMSMGEMWVLPTCDLDCQYKMEGYIAWKWGTVSKLPITHPYKNNPPYV